MNPRPYSSDWQSLSESELLAAYAASASTPAEERTRVPAEESDLAYAARLFERVASDILLLDILADWGCLPTRATEHLAAPESSTNSTQRDGGKYLNTLGGDLHFSAGCGISPRSSISPAGSPPAAAGHFPSEAP